MPKCTVICSDGRTCDEPTEFAGPVNDSWVCTEHAGLPENAQRPARKSSKSGETDQEKAIRLLRQQIDRINTIPDFLDGRMLGWFDTTKNLLTKFLGRESNTVKMFDHVSWAPKTKQTLTSDYEIAQGSIGDAKKRARDVFNIARGQVIQLLNSGIEHISEFGIATSGPPENRSPQTGSVYNTYHGAVTIQNQANATNKAIQHAVLNGSGGHDLTEITKLLQESMQLTRYEVRDGLKAVEDIAAELSKTEAKRDSKTILERGNLLLSITTKMVELKDKLAPHLPTLTLLVDQAAKHFHR